MTEIRNVLFLGGRQWIEVGGRDMWKVSGEDERVGSIVLWLCSCQENNSFILALGQLK